jgi:hypothetical protein
MTVRSAADLARPGSEDTRGRFAPGASPWEVVGSEGDDRQVALVDDVLK